MSIYSGFATRMQQQTYDQCIDSLIYVLQKRIIKFYKNQDSDQQKFITIVTKLHSQLKNMENNKYLEPKTSNTFNELIKFMNLHSKNFIQFGKKYLQQAKSQQESLPNLQSNPPKQEIQDENSLKKKNSLWVPKAIKNTIDQQIQTLGSIYAKKQTNSIDNSSVSKRPLKYVNNIPKSLASGRNPHGTIYRQEDPHSTTKIAQKNNRSNSYHIKKNEKYALQNQQQDHLKQVETIQKRKRQSKLHSRLGLKDLNTQQQAANNEVGDIIKEYLMRIKKSYVKLGKHRQTHESRSRINDF